MYDRELALEIASQIHKGSQTILKRFEAVESPGDFTNSEAGMEKLDSICMQLIAIGEGLKNLDKVTGRSLLPRYPEVDWKKAKGLRDIISHHYFDVNAEAIFEVCKTHIPLLGSTIHKLMDDITSSEG
jgi:uncharacterized protein with HEPN domain